MFQTTNQENIPAPWFASSTGSHIVGQARVVHMPCRVEISAAQHSDPQPAGDEMPLRGGGFRANNGTSKASKSGKGRNERLKDWTSLRFGHVWENW